MASETPKITLYTNHLCPFAHRAHTTLEELGLPYEQVIIDLQVPREPWYLEVNPRGLVPSLKYESSKIPSTILTESATVSQFLVDAHPSRLLPPSSEAPLLRARINFFVDTFNNKVSSYQRNIAFLEGAEAKEAKAKELVEVIRKEIEPLLPEAGQGPFFGGSEEFTFAETQVGPFIARLYGYAEHGEHIPKSLIADLEKLPKFSRYAKAVISRPTLTKYFPLEGLIEGTRKRIAALKQKELAAKA
ncbi:glutathione-S-transferas-like protein omega 1 [Eremomyces bilateralis CBS 781.70]|uniref:Glutathione-S-transferas-like protein omega 1 n=1 Tax=Eremomyces bilateralis CBS 781.70 TaxID=1392243 RepID=A0A6G1G777_9PEZI|nr:glutathione-S-transferas-like protein omega 1 [Eremomyces bilateralis CBS 781.70]KAF1813791.1 glutathione-S-transferas-like protein omega 1 [Eremomyces bilateralis CBS 781.70]